LHPGLQSPVLRGRRARREVPHRRRAPGHVFGRGVVPGHDYSVTARHGPRLGGDGSRLRHPMTWLHSLRSRIFFACALLAVLSIGAAVYVVSVRVTAESERALQREIVTTVDLVEQLRSTRV